MGKCKTATDCRLRLREKAFSNPQEYSLYTSLYKSIVEVVKLFSKLFRLPIHRILSAVPIDLNFNDCLVN